MRPATPVLTAPERRRAPQLGRTLAHSHSNALIVLPGWVLAAIAPTHARWTFGVHDTSAMSWLCVAAYLTATLCSLRAFAARAPDRHPKARSFWLLLAIGLVGLGINKPLDLHDLAIQVGRDLSIAEGWYAERRIVLGACLLAAAGAGAVGAVWLHRRLHPLSREMRLAFGSFAALAGLLLLRGSPFPIVADLLTLPLLSKEDGLFHIHFSEVLELLILVAIAVAARRTARGRPSDRNGG